MLPAVATHNHMIVLISLNSWRQIIPYHQQNSLSAWHCWLALVCVSDVIPALHPIQ